jgi:hypothetical protein
MVAKSRFRVTSLARPLVAMVLRPVRIILLAFAVICAGASAPSSSAGGLTDSVSSGPPAELGIGCPSPPGAPHGIHVWIHVTKWCSLPAVRDQAQFKLQLQIYNLGSDTLAIGQEHIRLIVATLDPRNWSPPRHGPETVERPFRTTYIGEHVWAVPANAEGASDPIPYLGERTLVTYWGASSLAPKSTFNPSFHSGDLVFYVPYLPDDPRGVATRKDVLGVAYMYGRGIVVLCTKGNWEKNEESAANF